MDFKCLLYIKYPNFKFLRVPFLRIIMISKTAFHYCVPGNYFDIIVFFFLYGRLQIAIIYRIKKYLKKIILIFQNRIEIAFVFSKSYIMYSTACIQVCIHIFFKFSGKFYEIKKKTTFLIFMIWKEIREYETLNNILKIS